MLTLEAISAFRGRRLVQAVQGDPALGRLSNLPGSWQGQGRGWNMIALPDASASLKFRLLLNQFDEELDFTCAFLNIPNRGIPSDQFLTGLQYTQDITQIIAVDSEGSSISPLGSAGIHHEPGFFGSVAEFMGRMGDLRGNVRVNGE